jgi:hypothetical protein
MVMTRRLTTLFVDIAGSIRLLVHYPPETVLGVVRCFMDLVSDVALAHHGHVKDFEGDGVLLYFESTRDATEAALAIRASLGHVGCDAGCEGGPAAAARISITVGDIAVGTVGPATAPALALVGQSVNVGSRLLKVLPPGGIVASEEVVAALRAEAPALSRHPFVTDEVLPAVGASHEADRPADPWRRAGDCQRMAVALDEHHGGALVVANPGGIAAAPVAQVGSQQHIEAIITETSFEGREADPLQHHVAPGAGHDLFLDSVSPKPACIGEPIARHAGDQGGDFASGVALLLGEERSAVRHDESQIPRAG